MSRIFGLRPPLCALLGHRSVPHYFFAWDRLLPRPNLFGDPKLEIITTFVHTTLVKNITLNADEHVLEQARKKAARESTTLNHLFRGWLSRYLGLDSAGGRYRHLMDQLEHIEAGRKFTRDEMNER